MAENRSKVMCVPMDYAKKDLGNKLCNAAVKNIGLYVIIVYRRCNYGSLCIFGI